jgi:dsDNA-binding SOS-regulon protein
MGHINEPKDIDFLTQSPPLTEKERKELSTFIKKRKSTSTQAMNDQRKLNTKPKSKAQ